MSEQSIHVQMTSHQVAMAWMSVNFFHPLKSRSAWIIFGVVLLLVALANYILGNASRVGSVGEFAVGLLGFGGSWFLMMYTRVRRDQSVSRMYVEGFELSLRETGLLYRVGESSDLLPWEKFVRVLPTSKWLYLYFNSRWALIIPRQAFSSEDLYAEWLKVTTERIKAENHNVKLS